MSLSYVKPRKKLPVWLTLQSHCKDRRRGGAGLGREGGSQREGRWSCLSAKPHFVHMSAVWVAHFVLAGFFPLRKNVLLYKFWKLNHLVLIGSETPLSFTGPNDWCYCESVSKQAEANLNKTFPHIHKLFFKHFVNRKNTINMVWLQRQRMAVSHKHNKVVSWPSRTDYVHNLHFVTETCLMDINRLGPCSKTNSKIIETPTSKRRWVNDEAALLNLNGQKTVCVSPANEWLLRNVSRWRQRGQEVQTKMKIQNLSWLQSMQSGFSMVQQISVL